MTARATTRLLSVLAASAALVLLALWLLDDGAERTPVPHTPTATVADESPVPTVPVLDDTREPAPLAPSPLAAPTDVSPSSPPLAPLTLAVHHAHGPPAAGAIVAMYARDVDERFLLEAELDADGRWEHPGLDAPVTLFVVGASPNPARLQLDVARGTHALALPEGAWIAGVVLVEGLPPAQPFPFALSGPDFRDVLPRWGKDLGAFRLPGLPSAAGGSLRTDADGRFLVSGLAPHAEFRLDGPGGQFVRDDERSTPDPVRPPFDGYVLALTRVPVIRGRVLLPDGRPAAFAELNLAQHFARLPPPGNAAPGQGMGVWGRGFGARADEQGRFEFRVHQEVDLRCWALVDGRMQLAEGCPPATVRVTLHARHASGAFLEFAAPDRDPLHDIDLGDLFLEASPARVVRVRDTRGEPVRDALVQLVDRDPESQLLEPAWTPRGVDDDGTFTFLERDARGGFVVVLAPRHRAVRVQLDEHVGEDPIDVALPDSSGALLEFVWPGDVTSPPEGEWRLEIRGAPPVFTDVTAALPVDKLVRLQQHDWRRDRSSLGYMHLSLEGDDLVVHFGVRGDTERLDALTPGKPLQLRLYRPKRAARGNRPAVPERTYWEHELRLQPGEQRVIPVDLREPAGDG